MALPAALVTELGKTVTTPFNLVEIGFSSTLRYSTRGDVEYNSYSWIDSGLRVRRISQQGARGRSVQIEFSNHNNAFSTLIIAQGIRERSCKIWTAYGTTIDPVPSDQVTLVFDGFLVEINEISEEKVTVSAHTMTEEVVDLPRYRIAPPEVNHAPLSGTKIKWNDETIVIERGRY